MGEEKFLDTAGCDGVRLVPQRGNTARGFLRREELLRVRFKGERTGDFAVGSSVAAEASEKRLVSEVDAVEISDRDSGTDFTRQIRDAAVDLHESELRKSG